MFGQNTHGLRPSRVLFFKIKGFMRKYLDLRITVVLVCLAVFTLSLNVVQAAGGRIEGRVTDPKGANVAGAAITATDPLNNQTFTATTDQLGHYKIDGLPPGTYSITVSAPGFSDAHRDGIKVEEGSVASLDVKFEIAPIEAAVTVPVSGIKANSDSVYQQLRQQAKNQGDFAGAFATVNNLVIKRDAGVFTLRSAASTSTARSATIPLVARSSAAITSASEPCSSSQRCTTARSSADDSPAR